MATRPKIPNGVFTKTQVDNKTVNLLFFGNFYKMSFSEYYDGMSPSDLQEVLDFEPFTPVRLTLASGDVVEL